MRKPPADSALDGIAARLVALAVLVACVGMIIWLSREHWLPSTVEEATVVDNPELQACLDQRLGDITQMQADGVIDPAQADAFAARARALCAGQFAPSAPPALPGN